MPNLRPGRLVKRRLQDGIADARHREATTTRLPPHAGSVSRTVEGAVPTRPAIDLCPSPCSKRYLNISRTRRISTLSAGIPFLPLRRQRKKLHTGRPPLPDASRGRIASEFAAHGDEHDRPAIVTRFAKRQKRPSQSIQIYDTDCAPMGRNPSIFVTSLTAAFPTSSSSV